MGDVEAVKVVVDTCSVCVVLCPPGTGEGLGRFVVGGGDEVGAVSFAVISLLNLQFGCLLNEVNVLAVELLLVKSGKNKLNIKQLNKKTIFCSIRNMHSFVPNGSQ